MDILPYIVLLIVPVLGRMSDQKEDIRLMATNCFATLVQLMPLEVRGFFFGVSNIVKWFYNVMNKFLIRLDFERCFYSREACFLVRKFQFYMYVIK